MTIEIFHQITATSTQEIIEIKIAHPMLIKSIRLWLSATARFHFRIRDSMTNIRPLPTSNDTSQINDDENEFLGFTQTVDLTLYDDFDPILIENDLVIDAIGNTTFNAYLLIEADYVPELEGARQELLDKLVGDLTKVQQTEVATRNREIGGDPYITTDNEGQQLIDPGDPYFQIKQKGFKQLGRAN